MRKALGILFFNLLGFGLLYWCYATGGNGFWQAVDTTVFRFCNTRLVPDSLFLQVTALTNMRVFDVAAFLPMAVLFFLYYRQEDVKGRQRLISIGLLMLATAVAIKQSGRFLPISHPSPTLVFEDVNRLTALTDIPTKDADRNSFPGDHGMMLMIFAAFAARYFGRKAFLAAAVLVAVFSMPRIMSGAHWFTDVFVGALSMVCILLSWLLLTPASDFLAHWIERLVPWRFIPRRLLTLP